MSIKDLVHKDLQDYFYKKWEEKQTFRTWARGPRLAASRITLIVMALNLGSLVAGGIFWASFGDLSLSNVAFSIMMLGLFGGPSVLTNILLTTYFVWKRLNLYDSFLKDQLTEGSK